MVARPRFDTWRLRSRTRRSRSQSAALYNVQTARTNALKPVLFAPSGERDPRSGAQRGTGDQRTFDIGTASPGVPKQAPDFSTGRILVIAVVFRRNRSPYPNTNPEPVRSGFDVVCRQCSGTAALLGIRMLFTSVAPARSREPERWPAAMAASVDRTPCPFDRTGQVIRPSEILRRMGMQADRRPSSQSVTTVMTLFEAVGHRADRQAYRPAISDVLVDRTSGISFDIGEQLP